MLLLDDLQWADELSFGFLTLYQGGTWPCPGLFIVGTYRSEDLNDALRQLVQLAGAERHIQLSRLDEATVGEIVADMLALHQPDEGFVQFLAHKSHGNPFFVAEYLRTAVSEGLLRRSVRGIWQLAGMAKGAPASVFEALPLPSSLGELIERRLLGLSPEALALLELHAVLGREVDGALLEAAAGLQSDPLLDALGVLLAQQILEEDKAGQYRFAHDKLRETTYAKIPVDKVPHAPPPSRGSH